MNPAIYALYRPAANSFVGRSGSGVSDVNKAKLFTDGEVRDYLKRVGRDPINGAPQALPVDTRFFEE